jgi:hypothetical protein
VLAFLESLANLWPAAENRQWHLKEVVDLVQDG